VLDLPTLSSDCSRHLLFFITVCNYSTLTVLRSLALLCMVDVSHYGLLRLLCRLLLDRHVTICLSESCLDLLHLSRSQPLKLVADGRAHNAVELSHTLVSYDAYILEVVLDGLHTVRDHLTHEAFVSDRV